MFYSYHWVGLADGASVVEEIGVLSSGARANNYAAVLLNTVLVELRRQSALASGFSVGPGFTVPSHIALARDVCHMRWQQLPAAEPVRLVEVHTSMSGTTQAATGQCTRTAPGCRRCRAGRSSARTAGGHVRGPAERDAAGAEQLRLGPVSPQVPRSSTSVSYMPLSAADSANTGPKLIRAL